VEAIHCLRQTYKFQSRIQGLTPNPHHPKATMKLSTVLFSISFTTLALACNPDNDPAICDAPSVQLNLYSDGNCGNFEEAIFYGGLSSGFCQNVGTGLFSAVIANWNTATIGCDLYSDIDCPDASRLSKKSPTTGVDGVSSDTTTSCFGSGTQILSVSCLWV